MSTVINHELKGPVTKVESNVIFVRLENDEMGINMEALSETDAKRVAVGMIFNLTEGHTDDAKGRLHFTRISLTTK
jgi:hypothetical protein